MEKLPTAPDIARVVLDTNDYSYREEDEQFAQALAAFNQELKGVLAGSLPITPRWWGTTGPIPQASPIPLGWLEVSLIFTSMTLATSILNKIGEDIYAHFKKKIGQPAKGSTEQTLVEHLEELKEGRGKAQKDQTHQIQLIVRVSIVDASGREQTGRGGYLTDDRFETVIDALSALPQLVADVSPPAQNAEALQPVKPWIAYQFDAEEKRWKQRR